MQVKTPKQLNHMSLDMKSNTNTNNSTKRGFYCSGLYTLFPKQTTQMNRIRTRTIFNQIRTKLPSMYRNITIVVMQVSHNKLINTGKIPKMTFQAFNVKVIADILLSYDKNVRKGKCRMTNIFHYCLFHHRFLQFFVFEKLTITSFLISHIPDNNSNFKIHLIILFYIHFA